MLLVACLHPCTKRRIVRLFLVGTLGPNLNGPQANLIVILLVMPLTVRLNVAVFNVYYG